MAIKNRRGSYSSFAGGTALEDGEIGVVMSGDPNTTDGTGVYIDCGGDVIHRLLSDDDKTSLSNAIAANTSSISSINTTLGNVGSGLANSEGDSATVASGSSWTNVLSVSVDAGTWLFLYGAQFASNATGSRSVYGNASTSVSSVGRYGVTAAASPNSVTRVMGFAIFSYNAAGTFNVHVSQNSGSSLTVLPYVRKVRLK